jgi:magnesium chelatase accessory protein
VPERLLWERDGAHWPHRAASRFIDAGGLRWHVQVMGPERAPAWLLLHGTAASSHSWRDLAPRLATDHRVIVPDLPGHAFTTRPAGEGMSLPGMARATADLLDALALQPDAVIGHSAGAAVAVRMALDRRIAPGVIFGVNAALLPLPGPAGRLFSPLAKLLALNPLVPQAFAWSAMQRWVVERLLRGTGSSIDATGVALYQQLVSTPAHAAAALAMMANWDLEALGQALPGLDVPLALIVGARDLAVPPSHADELRAIVTRVDVRVLDGLGHLAHEEAPARVEQALREMQPR